MKSLCEHARMRSVVVFLEPTEVRQLSVAVVTIQCEDCGAPFEFVGIESSEHAKISEDRRELRLSIAEASKWRVQ